MLGDSKTTLLFTKDYLFYFQINAHELKELFTLNVRQGNRPMLIKSWLTTVFYNSW